MRRVYAQTRAAARAAIASWNSLEHIPGRSMKGNEQE